MPNEVKQKVFSAKKGIVVSDDWNDFMILIESRGVLSAFYWNTGA
jgi:hypothetical protein